MRHALCPKVLRRAVHRVVCSVLSSGAASRRVASRNQRSAGSAVQRGAVLLSAVQRGAVRRSELQRGASRSVG
eukprot:10608755-Lingulodinium_polyedra.AAC.1